jgi:HSP20 family molecular chaperone IbpA
MNTDEKRPTGTTSKSTIVIVGVITLAAGVLIGLTVTKSMGGNPAPAVTTAKIATNQMSSVASAPNPAGWDEWNPFQGMRDMQSQMDQMFNRMFERFRQEPSLRGFNELPGYSLSLDVRDLQDRFEVRAYLPDAKASDVNVSLENNRTLKVSVGSKSTEATGGKNASTRVTEWGQYEQVIQLPASAKADQMKIEHNGHELLITIPKA